MIAVIERQEPDWWLLNGNNQTVIFCYVVFSFLCMYVPSRFPDRQPVDVAGVVRPPSQLCQLRERFLAGRPLPRILARRPVPAGILGERTVSEMLVEMSRDLYRRCFPRHLCRGSLLANNICIKAQFTFRFNYFRIKPNQFYDMVHILIYLESTRMARNTRVLLLNL